jgi:starch synthase
LEVWHVAREFGGIAEAGGVKDAVSGLSRALARAGVGTVVVLPLYGFLKGKLPLGDELASFSLEVPDQDNGNRTEREPVKIFPMLREGVRFLLVDSPRFARKSDVYTYTAEDESADPYKKRGTGHWDSHQMNVILQKAALETSLSSGAAPDLFHCHDGHAAFLPAMMREDPRFKGHFESTNAVLTIHNAGVGYHQEIWSLEFARALTGLEESVLARGMLGRTVDPLLLASSYALMSTVSEQYARELLQEENTEVAGGLGKALRERGVRLHGITNGVEPEPYDPRDPEKTGLPFRFDPSKGDWGGKKKCRERLYQFLPGPRQASRNGYTVPLFSFIGRLTPQKGIDVLHGAIEELSNESDAPDFVVLGQGEREAEEKFRRLAGRGKTGGVFFLSRFDPPLAKLIYAASDAMLIPSAFEPCGLTDFHAQLMGTIPLVHRVGGLVKVRDGITGFSYDLQTPEALAEAVRRCLGVFRGDAPLIERIRKRAFDEIFELHTWDRVARNGYIPLYESWIPARGGKGTWSGT